MTENISGSGKGNGEKRGMGEEERLDKRNGYIETERGCTL